MLEKDLQDYIVEHNDEFIERYLKPIIFEKENCYDAKFEFLGKEFLTKGQKRADLVYRVKGLYPAIIVVELKKVADYNAVSQVCGYIKDIKERNFEIEWLDDFAKMLFGSEYRYYGIVVGTTIKDNCKRLIRNSISNSLGYVELYNKEFYCPRSETTYHYV